MSVNYYTELKEEQVKQGSIPVGCVPPACQLYVLQWASDISTVGGGVLYSEV